LIVDTGAPITHLDRERVAGSALRWDAHYNDLENLRVVRTAQVDAIEIGAFSVGRLRVGEHSLCDVNRVRRSRLDPPVDGLLGADVLGSCGAIIDYSSECIFLVHRDSPDGKKAAGGLQGVGPITAQFQNSSWRGQVGAKQYLEAEAVDWNRELTTPANWSEFLELSNTWKKSSSLSARARGSF
jgi:hypothetical protein